MSRPASTAEAAEGHGGGYRHEALLYSGAEEFLAGTLPFLREAVAAREPALVVLAAAKIELLREALEGDAERILFADMAEVGTNPARIIPAWQEFVSGHSGGRSRLRGIGEPIWAERSPAELAECQRHEALLNVCFVDRDLWLLCPHDTTALSTAVIAEARRNHHFVCDRGLEEVSATFPGVEALAAPFDEPLPDPPGDAAVLRIEHHALRAIRELISGHATSIGLEEGRAADLVFAVNEVVTNTLRHGGGEGTLTIWRDGEAVVCEVRDRGRIEDPMAGRVEPPAGALGGRGLWLANQLCELVQVRAFTEGGAVRVHMHMR